MLRKVWLGVPFAGIQGRGQEQEMAFFLTRSVLTNQAKLAQKRGMVYRIMQKISHCILSPADTELLFV